MLGANLYAQQPDSLNQLEEVVVQAYLSRQPILETPASIAVIGRQDFARQNPYSLLPAFNALPGVRMEERSPGSYRLSVRGSLLRSPFGIRNIKIYLNDLPFTDASGNTYLNLLDPEHIYNAEILKGPDGSLFGANSGGVVLLNLGNRDSASLHAGVSGGSFGSFREQVQVRHAGKRVQWNFGQAYQRADGYRQQSAMKRLSLFTTARWNYAGTNTLEATVLFSDLHYETPGGLTLEQFRENPRQARPGVEAQHTGIDNTTGFAGITHTAPLGNRLRHVVSIFSTLTDFRNPFITNYETRKETNLGFRTYFEYAYAHNGVSIKAYAGSEGQRAQHRITNYDNNGGSKGALQSADEVVMGQVFYFARVATEINERFIAELAASINQNRFRFREGASRTLANEWMPRFAVSYRFTPSVALRGSLSRGYSPPTVAEVRPSGGEVNPSLNAEAGWNREAGVRVTAWNNRLQVDASFFYFSLKQAIVRATREDDTEYFFNAGGTQQTGVEGMVHAWLVAAKPSGLVRGLLINTSYAFSNFRFATYSISGVDYSGNELTGVPQHNVMVSVQLDLPARIRVFSQLNSVSRIPLTDANTAYTQAYQLLQARVGWSPPPGMKVALEFFAGVDNLLNQVYSLGNDLNAFGGRYYNAAPPRNLYAGIRVSL